MPGRPRRSDACWTCRLRRKKCDGARPACRGCLTLGIDCHTSIAKPEWMDGAWRQKEMAQVIKARIKDGSSSRRERILGGPAGFVVTSQSDYSAQPESLQPHSESESPEPALEETNEAIAYKAPESTVLGDPDSGSTATWMLDLAIGGSSGQTAASLGTAWELDFMMMYLDYVFPFLFPFYRPPLVGTSRVWVLSFVRSSRAVLHSVLSLSALFFTFGLKGAFPETRNPCRSTTWRQLVEQARMSFEMLQIDLTDITRAGGNATLLDKARIMETITHLMVFDLFIGRSAEWEAHLAPAVTLFDEILGEASRLLPDQPGLACVLEQMKWSRPTFRGFEQKLWNPDQAAFRFFTAILLYIDIIASTSLRRAPLLKCHHSAIIQDLPVEEIDNPLDFYAFVGCQNWVLLAVGDIAALDAWRKNMQLADTLDPSNFDVRANAIFQQLREGLEGLGNISAPLSERNAASLGRLRPYYQTGSSATGSNDPAVPTRVWAHAAQIYLHTVVSGWDPSNTTIRWHVSQVLIFVRAIEVAEQIRTLAWPICVAGCLAQGLEQEQDFRNIINTVGDVQLRSAVSEAGRIMQEVWKRRDDLMIDAEVWDIASCLGILGAPVLLI